MNRKTRIDPAELTAANYPSIPFRTNDCVVEEQTGRIGRVELIERPHHVHVRFGVDGPFARVLWNQIREATRNEELRLEGC
jgi:hypothetical protein